MARLALLFVGTAGTVFAAAGCEPVAESKIGARFRDCAECPEMVVVPAGSFLMGSPASEKERDENEGPVHRVGIAAPFAMGVYEVTFAQWDVCEEDGGCRGHSWNEVEVGRGEGRPVVSVSWDDAQAYVRWLSAKTGKRYRLPSESEWEYAARAGTRTSRPWGDSESGQCRYANGLDAAAKRGFRTWEAATVASCDDGRALTAPVGRYEANAWGLHDVLGNVWEWTRDCWNGSYAGAPRDGSAWNSGDCSRHVLRGGSWGSVPRLLRSAKRHGSISGDRSHDTGFRVARTLTAAEASLDELPGQPFTVAVAPPSAEVRILDITAPYRAGMRLPAGNYRVEASAEGHETATETVPHGSSRTSHRLALRKLAAGRFRDCARCPEMVVVPAGSFLMGWRESEDGQDWPASALPMRRYYFPGPVHPVSIAAPFAVGVYEVTFSEWDACEEDGGCRGYSPNDRGWGRGRRPVINVNWADAQAYVQWLSEKTGKPYRLPSESEWEYAARAGARTLPPCGHGPGRELPGECLGPARCLGQRLGMDGGLLAWQLCGRAGGWQCMEKRRLRSPRCARRRLLWQTQRQLSRIVLPRASRLNVRQHRSVPLRRVSCGPDAHPMNLDEALGASSAEQRLAPKQASCNPSPTTATGQPCSGASAGSGVATFYASHRVPGSATARRRAAGAFLNKVL